MEWTRGRKGSYTTFDTVRVVDKDLSVFFKLVALLSQPLSPLLFFLSLLALLLFFFFQVQFAQERLRERAGDAHSWTWNRVGSHFRHGWRSTGTERVVSGSACAAAGLSAHGRRAGHTGEACVGSGCRWSWRRHDGQTARALDLPCGLEQTPVSLALLLRGEMLLQSTVNAPQKLDLVELRHDRSKMAVALLDGAVRSCPYLEVLEAQVIHGNASPLDSPQVGIVVQQQLLGSMLHLLRRLDCCQWLNYSTLYELLLSTKQSRHSILLTLCFFIILCRNIQTLFSHFQATLEPLPPSFFYVYLTLVVGRPKTVDHIYRYTIELMIYPISYNGHTQRTLSFLLSQIRNGCLLLYTVCCVVWEQSLYNHTWTY